MTQPTLFLATPLGAPSVHYAYLAGALRAMNVFHGRIAADVVVGSFLPRNRDVLTQRFLDSPCTHMLCVDSDVGWQPEQVQELLDADKEFIAGCYCMKNEQRTHTLKLLKRDAEGPIREAEHVPAGFLLLARSCVERMVASYPELKYDHGHALWSYSFEQGQSYDQEDVAFCRRWRRIGGDVWAHTGVWVTHYGDYGYLPK